jgi:hypothetical protein
MPNIEDKIRTLPLALQAEVEEFVNFLLEHQCAVSSGTPALTWAGALSDMASQYTSVELQHALMDWRSIRI